MYSCIYFYEDASLGVVGEKDKNLTLHGDFEERSSVEMKWGKSIYHGFIIKINESEDALEKFAKIANTRILKKLSSKPDSVPEELFSLPIEGFNTSSHLGKRARVATHKLNESKAQNQEFSPRKKKNTTTRKDSAKKFNEDDGKKMENISKKTAATTTTTKYSHKTKQKNKKSMEAAADLIAATDMFTQFSKSNQNTVVSTQDSDTPLTETWRLCCESSGNDDIFSFLKEIPAPPPDILNIFKALCRPEVQEYLKVFIRHFETTEEISFKFSLPWLQLIDS